MTPVALVKAGTAGLETHAGSAAIQSDIERTRAQMDQTLDALEEKLMPSRLLDESWQFLKDSSSTGASKVWQLAKDHPLPALTAGLGLGWLAYESRRGGRLRTGLDGGDRLSRDSRRSPGSHRSHGSDGSDGSDGSQAFDPADWSPGAQARAGNGAAGAVEVKGSKLSRRLRHQAQRTKSRLSDLFEERPLAAGAATLALGLLAGLAAPSTRQEDEWLGEKRDELLAEVK